MIIVDISNITLGQVFNSKAQLYREIGIEPASGMKNREYQDREVKRHISFKELSKNKRSIIITEIFLEAKPKTDNRGTHGNQTGNHIYAKVMDILVLAMMQKETCIDAPYNYIFTHQIPLFTSKYEKSRLNNAYGISKDFFIEFNTADTYLRTVTNKVQNSFIRSLNRLQKKGIITYKCIYKVIHTKDSESTIATDDEVRIIKEVQSVIYKKLGVDSNSFIPPNLFKKCRQEILEALRANTGLYNFWDSYNIELINKNLKNISKKEIESALKEITKLFIISTHKTMSTKKSSIEDEDENSSKTYMPFSYDRQIAKIIKLDNLIWIYDEKKIDDQNSDYWWQYEAKICRSWMSGEYYKLIEEKFNIKLNLK